VGAVRPSGAGNVTSGDPSVREATDHTVPRGMVRALHRWVPVSETVGPAGSGHGVLRAAARSATVASAEQIERANEPGAASAPGAGDRAHGDMHGFEVPSDTVPASPRRERGASSNDPAVQRCGL
jgi:hypothetical protein